MVIMKKTFSTLLVSCARLSAKNVTEHAAPVLQFLIALIGTVKYATRSNR